MSLLEEIIAAKRVSVRSRKGWRNLQEIRSRIADADATRPFQGALKAAKKRLHLIAEVKKASPSKGIIRADFDPVDIAQTYESGGASAISVLTEKDYFLGHPSYLGQVRAKVTLPVLQKDFILDELQIYEARAWGADAILLIVALLEPGQIRDYFELAKELSLDTLVEVHQEKELERVIEWAPIIGINNRDLTTFETNIETTFRLLPEIPSDRTVVSESGIASRVEIERLGEAGVSAVLIGESLMASEKIEEKMKEFLGKP